MKICPLLLFFLLPLITALTVSAKPWKGAELITHENFKYGAFEARIQIAEGPGLITTFFLWKQDSERLGVDWQEMDFEMFGKNGTYQTQLITPGQGGEIRTQHNLFHSPPVRADQTYYTYRMEWSPEALNFYLDGQLIRSETDPVEYAELLDPNKAAPMNLRMGVWAGDSDWSGRLDGSQVPSAAFVDWLKVYDYTPGTGDAGSDFRLRYEEPFDSFNYGRFFTANWTFEASISDYIPNNALMRDGKLVLAFTEENQTGWSGPVPEDQGSILPTIPARIEAEFYNIGGPGVGYLDNTPANLGALYGPNHRAEGVDLEYSYDLINTPAIGWTEEGEWTQYSLNLTPGTYDLVARAASELTTPGSLRVSLDGALIGEIDISSTGSWYSWQNFTLPSVVISGSDTAVLRLEFRGAEFNLNYFEFLESEGATTGGDQTGTPFGGLASTLPGKIQAENFDLDGPGISYSDVEPENFGLTYTQLNYRSGAVDIEASNDADNTPAIGWTSGGEWLAYTVEVTPGTYNLSARIASGLGFPGSMRVELGGRVLGIMNTSNTGGWASWQTLVLPGVSIVESGPQLLRLTFLGNAGFNLNWIELKEGTASPPAQQSPFGSVAATIPGQIEAEDYDLGGQGVAYSDAESENFGGRYRNDGVDIELSGDVDNGVSVGWFDDGQWMEYTVNALAGIYDMEIRVTSAESIVGDIRVSLNGAVLGTFPVESTGSWSNWTTLALEGIAINTNGEAVLRLEMVGDAVNLNWIRFEGTAPASNLAFATISQTGASASAMVDSDGDTASNLSEFAFGSLSGESSSQPVLPLGLDHTGNCCQTVPVIIGGRLTGSTYYAGGLAYHFQSSLDLDQWREAVTFIPNPTKLPAPPVGYQYITFRPSNHSNDYGFLRVLVEELESATPPKSSSK